MQAAEKDLRPEHVPTRPQQVWNQAVFLRCSLPVDKMCRWGQRLRKPTGARSAAAISRQSGPVGSQLPRLVLGSQNSRVQAGSNEHIDHESQVFVDDSVADPTANIRSVTAAAACAGRACRPAHFPGDCNSHSSGKVQSTLELTGGAQNDSLMGAPIATAWQHSPHEEDTGDTALLRIRPESQARNEESAGDENLKLLQGKASTTGSTSVLAPYVRSDSHAREISSLTEQNDRRTSELDTQITHDVLAAHSRAGASKPVSVADDLSHTPAKSSPDLTRQNVAVSKPPLSKTKRSAAPYMADQKGAIVAVHHAGMAKTVQEKRLHSFDTQPQGTAVQAEREPANMQRDSARSQSGAVQYPGANISLASFASSALSGAISLVSAEAQQSLQAQTATGSQAAASGLSDTDPTISGSQQSNLAGRNNLTRRQFIAEVDAASATRISHQLGPHKSAVAQLQPSPQDAGSEPSLLSPDVKLMDTSLVIESPTSDQQASPSVQDQLTQDGKPIQMSSGPPLPAPLVLPHVQDSSAFLVPILENIKTGTILQHTAGPGNGLPYGSVAISSGFSRSVKTGDKTPHAAQTTSLSVANTPMSRIKKMDSGTI